MNETKPKKMVSRNVAIALGIICVIVIAMIATIASMANTVSGLNQEYDKERAIAESWEDSSIVPSNLDSLFQNKVVLCENTNVTELTGFMYDTNLTLNYRFNYTGFLLVNITSSTTPYNVVSINWEAPQTNIGTAQIYSSLNRTVWGPLVALFPVMPTLSVEFYFGNQMMEPNPAETQTQTVTITYYY